jgi:hypothetical protein
MDMINNRHNKGNQNKMSENLKRNKNGENEERGFFFHSGRRKLPPPAGGGRQTFGLNAHILVD